MIEKLLKLAAIGNPQAEYLNQAIKEVKDTPFAEDMINEQRRTLEEAENLMPKLAMKLNMTLSELDQFLTNELTKSASAHDAYEASKPLLRRGTLGGHAARGALAIGGSALGAVAANLLNDLYTKAKSSATEGGNFKLMMKENPDLHDYPLDRVKSIFNTVHRLGGNELSGDPNIAGTVVRNHVMLGDFNKGVDMKSMSELVNARSNLSRGTSIIDSGKSLPGLDLYKHEIDAERNELGREQFGHNKSQDDLENKRKDSEATRRETEHGWTGQDRNFRNAIELARVKREKHKDLRDTREDQRKEEIHNQDMRYKYENTPPNKPRRSHP